MATRRDVLKTAGCFVLAGAAGQRPANGNTSATTGPENQSGQLRTITYNVLACTGYRDKNDKRKRYRPDIPREQMTRRFALELGLYQPDIITFQESPGEHAVAAIAEQLGFGHHCFFYSGEAWHGAMMSRYKILEHKNCPLASYQVRPEKLFTRHWGRAVLEWDKGPLVVYSAHLFPGGGSSARREPEITEMLAVMASDIKSGRSMLLQGDLNHQPEGPEYKRWRDAGLVDAFAARGVGPPSTIPSHDPQARIDYVWAHGPIVDRLSECRVLYEGAFRTNPDDPGSVALSDHLPLMATFNPR